MRYGSAVFWVIVAAAMGVVAVITSGPRETGVVEASVTLGVAQAEIAGVRVTQGGVATAVVRSGGAWAVEWSDADGQDLRWAADPELARAGVRLLATARFDARAGGGEEDLAGEGRTVEIVGADGASTVVSIGAGGIGGRLPARIEGAGEGAGEITDVWITSNLANSLTRASLLQWRDRRALAVEDSGRVEIVAGSNAVWVARTGGAWALEREPRVHVRQAAVDAAVRTIAQIPVVRFVEDDPGATGVDEPIAVVRLEGRDGWREMMLGAAANAGGTELFARLEGVERGEPVGPVLARVGAEQIGTLSAAPMAYVGDSPFAAERFDVAGVVIEDASGRVVLDATRSIDGWRGEGGVVPESDAVSAFVDGLGVDAAASVIQSPAYERLGAVTLTGIAGELAFDVGRGEDGRAMVVVQTSFGGLGYAYDQGGPAWVGWLIAALGSSRSE